MAQHIDTSFSFRSEMPLFSFRRRRTGNTSPAAIEPAASASSSGHRRDSNDNDNSNSNNSNQNNASHAEDRQRYNSSPTGSSRHRRDSYNSGDLRSDANGGRFGRRSRGLFRRRRSPTATDRHVDLANDQTLMKARSKVTDAENAEHRADAALHAARRAVREAKGHTKTLEHEAVDECGFSLP